MVATTGEEALVRKDIFIIVTLKKIAEESLDAVCGKRSEFQTVWIDRAEENILLVHSQVDVKQCKATIDEATSVVANLPIVVAPLPDALGERLKTWLQQGKNLLEEVDNYYVDLNTLLSQAEAKIAAVKAFNKSLSKLE